MKINQALDIILVSCQTFGTLVSYPYLKVMEYIRPDKCSRTFGFGMLSLFIAKMDKNYTLATVI